MDERQHAKVSRDCLKNCFKQIPFEFTVQIPNPMKRGVDYGFLKGENWNFGTDTTI